jgi:glucan phosphoethanolaminetransferase (alkaline phosphatase superfamily)
MSMIKKVYNYLSEKTGLHTLELVAGKQDQDIINYVIALILLFLLLPVALGNFFNVTTTSWSADVVTIWNILPILAIIGAFGMVLYMAYNKSGLGKKK